MKRRAKLFLKQALYRANRLTSRFLRLHVLPVHHYSPIADSIELEKTRKAWARASEMRGVDVDLDKQESNLRAICLPFQREYEGNAAYRHAVEKGFGPGYGYIEAQALHAVIRYLRPCRIIEVGSGTSTYCMQQAARENEAEGYKRPNITAIEPFPAPALRAMEGIELVPCRVQEVGFQPFEALRARDLLFIDSSHVVKPGGDVNFLILEVLPRLHEGVVIHFHDIYFPYDYQRDVLKTIFPWNETSLLHAFLLFNEQFEIIFCLSQLHYQRQELLVEVFPEYEPQPAENGLLDDRLPLLAASPGHFPSSIYLQVRPRR